MKKIVLVAFIVLGCAIPAKGNSFIELNDIAIYVADYYGKVTPYPAPDGTKITIESAGKKYTCTVATTNGHKTCYFSIPNTKAWKIVKVDWLFGMGYTGIQRDTQAAASNRFTAAMKRMFNRN